MRRKHKSLLFNKVFQNEQPRIEIYEQPQKRFRFRYKSEKGSGSHGSLKGIKDEKSLKSCPKIKIVNYTGKIKLRGTLYLKDVTINKPHVHKLDGLFCNEQGIFEKECIITDKKPIIDLAGISICNAIKNEIKNILKNRYIEKTKQDKVELQQLGVWKEDSSNTVTSQEEAEAENKAKEECKIIKENLNEVVIKFEAFVLRNETWEQLCEPVFSDPIQRDDKTAATKNLRIDFIHFPSGTARGGEEVVIFCEKVDQENIEIHFIEMREDIEVWKQVADSKLMHVHKQYAIRFIIPPYKDIEIVDNVEVDVKLYRPKDKAYSESVKFIYIPDDAEILKRKRRRLNQSSDGSSSKQFFKNPNCQTTTTLPEKRSVADLKLTMPKNNSSGYLGATCEIGDPHTAEVLDNALDLAEGYPKAAICEPLSYPFTLDNILEETYYIETPVVSAQKEQSSQDISMDVGNLFDIGNVTDVGNLFDTGNITDVGNVPYATLCSLPCVGSSPEEMFQDLQDSSEDPWTEFVKSVLEEVKSKHVEKDGPSDVSADSKKFESDNLLRDAERQLYLRAIKSTAKSLHSYAKTNDVTYLLENMRHLFHISDEEGNNAIHLSVIFNQSLILEKLLALLLPDDEISECSMVNIKNKKSQTPLHIAIYLNDMESVIHLIAHGANPNIKNHEGDTAIHIAAKLETDDILKELLSYKQSKINEYNNKGLTPLHLAVKANSLPCLKLLYKHKADLDATEKMSGYTALHMAVELHNIPIINYLLENEADIDVQNRMGGYNALHLAVKSNSEKIVKLLLNHQANPYDTTFGSSDENDEEKNAFDLSKNERITKILKGISVPDKEAETELCLPCGAEGKCSKTFLCKSGILEHTNKADSSPETLDSLDSSASRFDFHIGKTNNLDSGVYLSKNEIDEMDDEAKESLYKLFNSAGEKDWKALSVVTFGNDFLIDQIKDSGNPTARLLPLLETVDQLRTALEKLDSKEGLEIVDKYIQRKEKLAEMKPNAGITNDVTDEMKKLTI